MSVDPVVWSSDLGASRAKIGASGVSPAKTLEQPHLYSYHTHSTMSTSIQSARPLAGFKQALRQCRAERQRCRRNYATSSIAEDIPKTREIYPSLMPKSAYPAPSKGFRPSVTTKQNRMLLHVPTMASSNTFQASMKDSDPYQRYHLPDQRSNYAKTP